MIHCPKDKMINPVSFSVYFACLYNCYRLAWCSQDVTCIAWHEGHSSHDPWLSYLVLYYYRLATHSHFILYWANLDPGIDTHPVILSCSLSLANRLVNIDIVTVVSLCLDRLYVLSVYNCVTTLIISNCASDTHWTGDAVQFFTIQLLNYLVLKSIVML